MLNLLRLDLGISAVSVISCIGSRTVEHDLGFVGLSHMGNRLCVTDQGDTGRHAISVKSMTLWTTTLVRIFDLSKLFVCPELRSCV